MILINGIERCEISVADRGFHYGDGLFETIAIHQGEPRRWQRAMLRLSRDCARLHIQPPAPSLLYSEAKRACHGIARGVLKIILTRGTGGRGYRPPPPGDGSEPTRVLMTFPYPSYPAEFWEQGVAVRICSTRLGSNPALAGMKHLNRLEQVLARQEWDDPGIAEGLMLHLSGNVIEGTMTNLFMVHKGELSTPDLSRCGVAGIMRDIILETAHEMAVPTRVTAMTLADIASAEEIFLCNSLIGIWPVRAVAETLYTPGNLTRALTERVMKEC